jgi:hypothetical protein
LWERREIGDRLVLCAGDGTWLQGVGELRNLSLDVTTALSKQNITVCTNPLRLYFFLLPILRLFRWILFFWFNVLTLEFNPSAQRCLRFFTGILLLEPCVSVMYAWKTKKCNNYAFSLLIMYGREMLNWGTANRILWMGVLWRSQIATLHVTRHNTPNLNILSTAPQLNISQKALGTLPEVGNVMPKHVEATVHN